MSTLEQPRKPGRPRTEDVRQAKARALWLLAEGAEIRDVQARSGIAWARLAEMLADPELERTLAVLRGSVAA